MSEQLGPLDPLRFGFRFGAAVVWRHSELPDGRVLLMVTPDHGEEVSIYISRTGRSVRVFRSGAELKATSALPPTAGDGEQSCG